MTNTLYRAAGCLVVLALATTSLAAPPTTAELLQRLPEATNAVVVIQVQEIMKTPRAVREGWGQKHQTEFLAGAIPVNPTAERVIIGSQFDPGNPGKSWYVGLIPTKKPVPMEKVAERYKSSLEEIGGETAVFSPQVGYIVRFGDELFGTMGSNDRQAVSRWIRFARTNQKSSLSYYLRNAVSLHPTAHVFMVVDTDDLIRPQGVQVALLRSKQFVGNDALVASMHKFLSKLHGVRFVAQIGDSIKAKFYFDSAVEVTKDLEALKPFFIEVLGAVGAELPDLPSAKVSMYDRTVIMEFDISDADLAKLMSLMSSPMVHPDPGEVTSVRLTPEGIDVTASRRYYRSVNQLLEDLKKQNKRASDYMKTALWHETTAKKIAELSVLNVDKAVLQYGYDAVHRLQSIAHSLRGVPIQVGELDSKKYIYEFVSGWGWWGGGQVYTNIPQLEAQQVEIIKKDQQNRNKQWEQIDFQRMDLRSRMAEKYKVDFDSPLPKK